MESTAKVGFLFFIHHLAFLTYLGNSLSVAILKIEMKCDTSYNIQKVGKTGNKKTANLAKGGSFYLIFDLISIFIIEMIF